MRDRWGVWAFALGLIALAGLSLTWGKFAPGQPVSAKLPHYADLAMLANSFMLVCAMGLLWRRMAGRAALALLGYYVVIVLVVMNGPLLARLYRSYGIYESLAIQAGFAVGALLIFADGRSRLVRAGQIVFGVCCVIYGGAHFAYMNLTAPLVPQWLPPSQVFWGQATGAAQIAAGLAFLSGVQARLAGMLLTLMYALFQVMIHIPSLFTKPGDHFAMTENRTNLALIGVAWLIAQPFSEKLPNSDASN
jgi:uncharacterized membrane protein YphA (DoxX/SURF4 family)